MRRPVALFFETPTTITVYNDKACRQYKLGTPQWKVFLEVMGNIEFTKVVYGIKDIGALFAENGVDVQGDIVDVKVMAAYKNELLRVNTAADIYNYYTQNLADMPIEPFAIDTALNSIMLQVRKTGVRIDIEELDKLIGEVEEHYYGVITRLSEYGLTPEIIKSSKQLGTTLNCLGIHSEIKTANGAESWNEAAMIRLTKYPVIRMLGEFRTYDTLLTTLRGSIKSNIKDDGRIHCVFNPVGAVTGRFSCNSPNLQSIPARKKVFGVPYGKRVRSLFIPEEDCYFGAADYSQIEYLLLCNYACGSQAKWLREQALAGVDFHNVAMALTGIESRDMVKPFNYGAIYGMGWRTALVNNYELFSKKAEENGVTAEQYAFQLYTLYHKKFPAIKDTMAAVEKIALKNGYVKTLGGRKIYLPPEEYNPMTNKMERPMYKMLNHLLQGSAADIIKQSIITAYAKGVFNELTFHLTEHDELDFSIPKTRAGVEAAKELVKIMTESYKEKLKIPMKVECDVGCNWGYWKDDLWKALVVLTEKEN